MFTGFKSYGFETILNPRSQCPYTGKETVKILDNNIKLYVDEVNGSYRFVMYQKGRSISALQLTPDYLHTILNRLLSTKNFQLNPIKMKKVKIYGVITFVWLLLIVMQLVAYGIIYQPSREEQIPFFALVQLAILFISWSFIGICLFIKYFADIKKVVTEFINE